MILYSGPSKEFIGLNKRNLMAGMLRDAFLQKIGRNPSNEEFMSWQNSLNRMADIFIVAGLEDQGVMLEYQLGTTGQRLDFLVFGNDVKSTARGVIVELKQWSRTELSEYDTRKVMTWVAGGNREVLHPAAQVGAYCEYLRQNVTAFYEPDPVALEACSYLHNYPRDPKDPLFDPRFASFSVAYPVFVLEDFDNLTNYLVERVGEGQGMPILRRVEKAKSKPSPKLLKQVASVVKQKLKGEFKIIGADEDYILLNEQAIAYEKVLALVNAGLSAQEKHAVIINGGPGTGKSVIALKLLADLTAAKKHAEYATGSSSFTQTLRKLVGDAYKHFFQYFMSYPDAKPNGIDVLIMDEAHRIREKTVRRDRASTGLPQVEELIHACKVSVFLLDDLQAIRPNEIGRAEFIRSHAERLGCTVHEYQLTTQFRCAGSEAFISWVEHMLHLQITAHPEWVPDDNFEFKIFSTPQDLDAAIRAKVAEGNTGRLMAGFCWPWSAHPNTDGSLVEDVVIGDFKRPWNAQPGVTGLKRGIPKSHYWAYDDGGLDQIGCIYTAQGFEFDYAGVIIGKDLTFDFTTNAWSANKEHSKDRSIRASDQFSALVKNTYRVLLTRGQKGCYVYFEDKATENYFRSRIRATQPA